MTTKTKVAFARILYQSVRRLRQLTGRDGTHAVVERRGSRWSLDLNEGIDLSIFLFGAFERSTVTLLEKLVKPGDVVLDIGANIGAHTLFLARAVGAAGKVVAFEPTGYAFGKLKRNLALNPALEANVRAEQVMLVAEAGTPLEAEIYSSWPLDAYDIHPKLCARAMGTDHAHTERLDDYAARIGMDRLDLIKMDVDGHESQVLLGAKEVLQKFHPVILMELSPYIHSELGQQEDEFTLLITLLRDLGYSMRSVDTEKQLPLDPVDLAQLVPDGSGINVLLSI